MSAIAPLPAASSLVTPRREEVRRDAIVVEGHTLEEVVLGGYVIGPALGTAPVVIVVGGITASPFPFGDAGERHRGVVARAPRARADRSGAHDGAVSVLARQRIDVARLRRRADSAAVGARPRRPDRRLARRHRLHHTGDVHRREPRRARRDRVRRAASRARARGSSRSPPACAPTAGAPRRATSSASSCAMACAPATSRPAWRARASSAC